MIRTNDVNDINKLIGTRVYAVTGPGGVVDRYGTIRGIEETGTFAGVPKKWVSFGTSFVVYWDDEIAYDLVMTIGVSGVDKGIGVYFENINDIKYGTFCMDF